MKKLLLILTALISIAPAADAKWWIFGKANDEVGIKYLYVNKVSADEAGARLKIFREALGADGLVRINGKAAIGRGAVGSVRISLDDKATWTDVKFADNGTFEYSFKPETGRTYTMLVEVTDTAGKTNKVEDTRKEISLSEENVQAKVKETLDAMFAAYNAKNLRKLMGYVGEDFAGDKAILERAVKRDFDALSSINLRYTLNNIAAGAQGRVFVSVTYNRMVLVNKTGLPNSDTGSTEFVFGSKEGKFSLYSMKQPLMFGLSDAENVATGSVLGGGGTALVLDDSGALGGGAAITRSYNSPDAHFSYDTGTASFADCDGTAANCTGSVFFMPQVPYIGADDVPASALIGEIAGRSFSSVTLADIRTAATQQIVFGLAAGKIYGLKYNADYFAIEIVSLSGSGAGPYSITIKTKAF